MFSPNYGTQGVPFINNRQLTYFQYVAILDTHYLSRNKRIEQISMRSLRKPLNAICRAFTNDAPFHMVIQTLLNHTLLERFPAWLDVTYEELRVLMHLSCAESTTGVPGADDGHIHPCICLQQEWWQRNVSEPDLTIGNIEAYADENSLFRLTTAQGHYYDIELHICTQAEMLRHYIVKHHATSLVLPTIGYEVLESIIFYMRWYSAHDVTLPRLTVTSPDLRQCGLSEWECDFLRLERRQLLNMLLAANLLGIPSLIEILAKGVVKELKYPISNYLMLEQCLVNSAAEELSCLLANSREQEIAQNVTERPIQVGDLVRIHGLTRESSLCLNDKLAQVVLFFENTARVGVVILDTMTLEGAREARSILERSLLCRSSLAYALSGQWLGIFGGYVQTSTPVLHETCHLSML